MIAVSDLSIWPRMAEMSVWISLLDTNHDLKRDRLYQVSRPSAFPQNFSLVCACVLVSAPAPLFPDSLCTPHGTHRSLVFQKQGEIWNYMSPRSSSPSWHRPSTQLAPQGVKNYSTSVKAWPSRKRTALWHGLASSLYCYPSALRAMHIDLQDLSTVTWQSEEMDRISPIRPTSAIQPTSTI